MYVQTTHTMVQTRWPILTPKINLNKKKMDFCPSEYQDGGSGGQVCKLISCSALELLKVGVNSLLVLHHY